MRAQSLLRLVHDVLINTKGQQIRVLHVSSVTDITDYMVLVNGTSNRHVLSMADKVIQEMREYRCKPIGVEGEDVGDWVLIDFGDVVLHIMRPQTREFYNLERLWGSSDKSSVVEI